MTAFERAACAHAESRGSPGARYLYKLDLGRWLAFCELEKIDPARPTLEAATKFREALRKKQSSQSIRRILGLLSAMYEAALACEVPVASWNPFKKLPRPPKYDYAKTEAIPKEDAEEIFAVIGADCLNAIPVKSQIAIRDMAVLRLLYDTGLRVSSVLAIERMKLVKRGSVLVATDVFIKGDKRGEVALPTSAALAVESWLQARVYVGTAWLFPARNGKEHMREKAVNKRLNLYAKRAGVKSATPHMFRAAFITEAIDAGVPLVDVQASVHHADPATTLKYDRGKRGAGVTEAVAKFRTEIK